MKTIAFQIIVALTFAGIGAALGYMQRGFGEQQAALRSTLACERRAAGAIRWASLNGTGTAGGEYPASLY